MQPGVVFHNAPQQVQECALFEVLSNSSQQWQHADCLTSISVLTMIVGSSKSEDVLSGFTDLTNASFNVICELTLPSAVKL